MTRDGGKGGAFGVSLGEMLDKHAKRQSDLARELGTTRSYVSQIASGKKNLSGEKIDLIAGSIGLSAAETVSLHRAAAIDAGYRIDPFTDAELAELRARHHEAMGRDVDEARSSPDTPSGGLNLGLPDDF